MKKFIIIAAFTLLSCFAHAQVGIGNTNPSAALDISASDVSAPSNTDGILIPRLDEFPAVDPTAAQDGMMVFITGNGAASRGFFYWDQAGTNWVTVNGSSISKVDDLIDGKSDNDGTEDGSSIFLGINAGAADDSSDNKNVGVGFEALETNSLGFENTAVGYSSLNANSTGDWNTAIGKSALTALTTTNYNTAVGYNSLLSVVTGAENTAIGQSAGRNTLGSSNIFLGNGAGANEIGSHTLYIDNTSSDNPLIYGEFDNDLLRANAEFQIGNPLISGYAFPISDGGFSQVLYTNGSGQLSFVDPAVFGDGTGTDDQKVNTFGLAGDTLGISLENDGDPVQTVDLSNLSFNVSNFALAKIRMNFNQAFLATIGDYIDFRTANFDINSNFNTTTDRFEVTETGYYRIDASFGSTVPSAATDLYFIEIRVNGTTVKSGRGNHSGAGEIYRSVSTIETLSPGDYIEIFAFGQSAFTIDINTQRTSFSVERIR